MSIFDFLTRHHDLEGNRHAKRPGDVWCVEWSGKRHAVDYLCRFDFYVVAAPVMAICLESLPVTGHARPGRPSCSACLKELNRAAPILAKRLDWTRRNVSTCGRWRVRRLRKPPFAGYDVMECVQGRWVQADSAWYPDVESAKSYAQELETKRLCVELVRERMR